MRDANGAVMMMIMMMMVMMVMMMMMMMIIFFPPKGVDQDSVESAAHAMSGLLV